MEHQIGHWKIKWVVFLLLCTSIMSGCKEEKVNQHKEKVRLEFYSRKKETFSVMNEIIQSFNESQDDIEVYQSMNPNVDTALRIDIVKEEMPDIVELVGLQGIETFEYIRGGYLLPLSGEKFLERVQDEYLPYVTYDGEIYQIPLTLSFEGIFLNKAKFKQAGLPCPETYEQLLHVCRQIQQRGESAFLFADGESWLVHQNWENIESAYRGTFWDIWSEVAQKETTFEEDEISRGAMEKLIELHQFTLQDSMNIGYDEALYRFAAGDSYMFMQGNWAYQACMKWNPKADLELIPFPIEEGQEQKLAVWIDSSVGISRDCQHPKEAKKFLEFLSRPENQQVLVDQGYYSSCLKGVTDRGAYAPKIYEMIQEKKETIDNAVLPLAPSTVRDHDIQVLMPDADKEEIAEYLEKYSKSLQKHGEEFLRERDKIK